MLHSGRLEFCILSAGKALKASRVVWVLVIEQRFELCRADSECCVLWAKRSHGSEGLLACLNFDNRVN